MLNWPMFSGRVIEAGLSSVHERLLLQEYVNHPQEYGVMYIRHPSDDSGRITSIVGKEFLKAEGDGESTLAELVRRGERSRLHASMLSRQFSQEWDQVLGAGEGPVDRRRGDVVVVVRIEQGRARLGFADLHP